MKHHLGSPNMVGIIFFIVALFAPASAQSRYTHSYSSDNSVIDTLSEEGVWERADTRGTYAQFSLNKSTIQGELAVAYMDGSVSYGCGLGSVPSNPGKIVIIQRGNCRFLLKAWNVQMAGAIAMIVVDHDDRSTPPIMSSGMESIPLSMASLVSVAVRASLGASLIQRVQSGEKVIVQISHNELESESDSDIAATAAGRIVSYTCGVAISAIVIVMATRVCQRGHLQPAAAISVRELQNRQLERCDELLKALEGYKFSTKAYRDANGGIDKSEDDAASSVSYHGLAAIGPASLHGGSDAGSIRQEENGEDDDDAEGDSDLPTCCICLGEFEDDEKILRLPCSHEFHDECIAEWLRHHVECPLCKANVYEMVFTVEDDSEDIDLEDNLEYESNTDSEQEQIQEPPRESMLNLSIASFREEPQLDPTSRKSVMLTPIERIEGEALSETSDDTIVITRLSTPSCDTNLDLASQPGSFQREPASIQFVAGSDVGISSL